MLGREQAKIHSFPNRDKSSLRILRMMIIVRFETCLENIELV